MKHPKFFLHFAVLSTVVVLLSNIAAVKLFSVAGIVLTAGVVLFPLAYIVSDVVVEVYGYERARTVIWLIVATNLLMSVTFIVTSALPPLVPEIGDAYSLILNQVPRLVVASLLGVWGGKFSNAVVMSKMKVWTQGRYLWARTIGSSVVGQIVDSALFAGVGFLGVYPFAAVWSIFLVGAFAKLIYEIAFTPVTYAVVNWIKRLEGDEVVDVDVNYSPFARSEV